MVINAAAEAEKKTRTIKAAVQLEIVSHHPRTFMGMIGGNPSIKMDELGRSFQSDENKYMVA